MLQKSASLIDDFNEDDTFHNKLQSLGPKTIHERQLHSMSTNKITQLERFTEAKKKSIQIFDYLKSNLSQCLSFLKQQKQHDIKEDLLIQMITDSTMVVENWYQQAESISEIISRRNMKIAFFGRTSNGKSTTINAMLHDKVLPSGLGHTTCCFCEVNGIDGNEGYIVKDIDNDSNGSASENTERLPLENVEQLTSALQEASLDTSRVVKVYWPKSRCSLLQHEVVLMDSPGVDIDENIDTWIDKHCLDADVFVMVTNAESTLSKAEKSFFIKVSEKLSRPNIFILNNRWDLAAEDSNSEKIRLQHKDKCEHFLTKELKSDNEYSAIERIFFVSAKEMISRRATDPESERSVAQFESSNARTFEFERFEDQLLECLSVSAVRTKFSQHIEKGLLISNNIQELMNNIEKTSESCLETLAGDLNSAKLILIELEKLYQELCSILETDVNRWVQSAEKKARDIFRIEKNSLGHAADKFDLNYYPDSPNGYRTQFVNQLDTILTKQINNICSAQLTDFLRQIGNDMYEKYVHNVVPSKFIPDRFGYSHVEKLNLIQFNFDMQINAQHILADFTPNLDYRFFLSPVRLIPFFIHLSSNSAVRTLTNFIPLPASQLMLVISREFPIIPIAVVISSIFLLKRLFNWKAVFGTTACYGVVFVIDYSLYTPTAQAASLRRQIVDQLQMHLGRIEPNIISSPSSHFRREISDFISGLNSTYMDTIKKVKEDITTLELRRNVLVNLKEKASDLRKKGIFTGTDFSRFRGEYIQ